MGEKKYIKIAVVHVVHHIQRGRQQTIYPTDCSKRGTDRKLRASTTQSTHQFVYLSHPLRFLSAAKNKAPFLDSRSMHKILVPEARETTDLRAETGTSVTLHACHGLTWSCLMSDDDDCTDERVVQLVQDT